VDSFVKCRCPKMAFPQNGDYSREGTGSNRFLDQQNEVDVYEVVEISCLAIFKLEKSSGRFSAQRFRHQLHLQRRGRALVCLWEMELCSTSELS